MFSSLHFGFFDSDALRSKELVAARPLDLEQVDRLFREYGTVESGADFEGGSYEVGIVGGHRFLIFNGGVVQTTRPLVRPAEVEFVERLVRDTGCEIAFPDAGGRLSTDAIRRNAEILRKIFADELQSVSTPVAAEVA